MGRLNQTDVWRFSSVPSCSENSSFIDVFLETNDKKKERHDEEIENSLLQQR